MKQNKILLKPKDAHQKIFHKIPRNFIKAPDKICETFILVERYKQWLIMSIPPCAHAKWVTSLEVQVRIHARRPRMRYMHACMCSFLHAHLYVWGNTISLWVILTHKSILHTHTHADTHRHTYSHERIKAPRTHTHTHTCIQMHHKQTRTNAQLHTLTNAPYTHRHTYECTTYT
jgi:hypothetical protein